MTDATKILQDAAYITIGAGVLAFQKIQVQRQELKKQLESQVGEARESFTQFYDTVEDRLKAVEERLGSVQTDVEERFGSVQSQVEERFQGLQAQVEQAGEKIESNVERYLDEVEARLPQQARELVAQARTAAKDAQTQLRQLVGV